MATKKSRAMRGRKAKLTARQRAARLLKIQNGELTLYSAYLIVLIRLVVILFHSGMPHMS